MKEAFQIGPVTVRPPFLSAPMAGFTNGAFRSILRHFGGVGLIATEMISARAFVHRSGSTFFIHRVSQGSRRVHQQSDLKNCRFGEKKNSFETLVDIT